MVVSSLLRDGDVSEWNSLGGGTSVNRRETKGTSREKERRRNAAESQGPEVVLSQEPRREKVVCGTDKRERKRKKENEDTSSTPIL